MVDLEELDFFKNLKSNSTKKSVGIAIPTELKNDIMTVAHRYEISANAVVTECIQRALSAHFIQNIDFSTATPSKTTTTLVVYIKKSMYSAIRKKAEEYNIAVSTVIRLCIEYVFATNWKNRQDQWNKYAKFGKIIYEYAQSNNINTESSAEFQQRVKKLLILILIKTLILISYRKKS